MTPARSFDQNLEVRGTSSGWRWLLACLSMLGCSERASDSAASKSASPTVVSPVAADYLLSDVTGEWGIDFVHDPGPASFFFPEIVGSGVALLDFDQDGRLDIYFRTGTGGPPHPKAKPDTPRARSRLFQQQAGGRFIDVTERSGLGDPGYGMGVAVGDVNNDGYPDVYAVNFGGDRLYLNRRDGTFADVTSASGLDNAVWGSSACFVDMDRDGLLDLYVANYVDYSNPKPCTLANGREDYCAPSEYPGTSDKLYRNVTNLAERQKGPAAVRFEDISVASGIAGQKGPGLGARPGDFNHDGWPDIYVANDGAGNFMWMNQKNGTFRELALPLGTAYNNVGKATASMGIAEGDVNDDGRMDLAVTNLRAETNNLYHALGSSYQDMAAAAGVQRASKLHTGFGVALTDLDHDGDLDLVLANGHVFQPVDRPAMRPPDPPDPTALRQFWRCYADSNQLLANDGQGRFEDVSPRTGPFAQELESSRALAVGDLDRDGDVDVVLTNVAGPARVYRNDVKKAGHWLQLRVVDPKHGGRDAYGALVTVTAGTRKWMRQVQPASSFQACDDVRLHFGLGATERVDTIEVRWPDGSLAAERFSGESVDIERTLKRGAGTVGPEQ